MKDISVFLNVRKNIKKRPLQAKQGSSPNERVRSQPELNFHHSWRESALLTHHHERFVENNPFEPRHANISS
jgi:hypothetical protein